MKIVYLPLDERPCNVSYPKMYWEGDPSVQLLTPAPHLLGNKKSPADIEGIWRFLEDALVDASAAVINIELLFYGGLLPSRLHYFTLEQLLEQVARLQRLTEKYPKVTYYVSSLIMRTPQYSSSDEEPDYYEEHGRAIFRQAFLSDKQNREGTLTKEEALELAAARESVPAAFTEDYEKRRAINLEVNKAMLQLLKKGHIEMQVIPQDDAALYGYTALDQNEIKQYIRENRLMTKVHMYPGADEVGSTLTTRAYLDFVKKKPRIYVAYASLLGQACIPLYEDRPIDTSCDAHILAIGATRVWTPEDADLILAYNVPGSKMQEASQQDTADRSYQSFRNMHVFVDRIGEYIAKGIPVSIADSAYVNGGDLELIESLDITGDLDKLVSYKAWNTNCNTLGTALAAGIVGLYNQNKETITRNLVHHLLEDGFYQSVVRKKVCDNYLEKLGVNYFDLGTKTPEVTTQIAKELQLLFMGITQNSFKNLGELTYEVESPWNRMFEIGIAHLKFIK